MNTDSLDRDPAHVRIGGSRALVKESQSGFLWRMRQRDERRPPLRGRALRKAHKFSYA
jgi:hypothetical protein